MTNYYNIKTINSTKYWNSNKIIKFLNDTNKFTYDEKGCFKCKNEYCIISIVYTNDFNSFLMPNDFDSNKTNYIDIITSCDLSIELMNLLNSLAQYLGAELEEED